MPKIGVRKIEISPEQSGRRLDNYLTGILKNVPKSFIYRIIRRGEVRVNGSRSRPDTRLKEADIVRIPPLSGTASAEPVIGAARLAAIERAIVFENDAVLVLDKPSGMAVHGGSGLRFGVIDIVRRLRPGDPGIELAHRLDRDTSGCLIFTKDYPTLRLVQRQLSSRDSHKTYLTLLRGELSQPRVEVDLSLATSRAGGEKRTVVADDGKHALTEFTLVETLGGMSLARVTIATGRTHQIRVHAAAIGHPVTGDRKYGDRATNSDLRRLGLHRMFLHAVSITLTPGSGSRKVAIDAPLPADLLQLLRSLRC
jgi:23S rRNA pseudouridine955/2504/2580 synthase